MTDRLSEIRVRAQQMDDWDDVSYLLSLLAQTKAERDALQAQVEAMREALEDYGTHGRDCALYPFREYDPKRGYLYGDKWTPEPPPCTCGLTEAISLTALTESRRAEQAVIEAAKKIRDSNCADYCWAGISPPTPGKHQKDCAIGHLVDALSRLERGTQP